MKGNEKVSVECTACMGAGCVECGEKGYYLTTAKELWAVQLQVIAAIVVVVAVIGIAAYLWQRFL